MEEDEENDTVGNTGFLYSVGYFYIASYLQLLTFSKLVIQNAYKWLLPLSPRDI